MTFDALTFLGGLCGEPASDPEPTGEPGSGPAGAATEPVGDSYADAEWRRFWSVARPWPDGTGFYDPGDPWCRIGLRRDSV